jgi:hypothetical protein
MLLLLLLLCSVPTSKWIGLMNVIEVGPSAILLCLGCL